MNIFGWVGSLFTPARSFLKGVLREATGEALGKQVPQFVREHVVEGPPRERLMRDIYKNMLLAESANLRRRIQALGGNHPENRLVTQLCKIYKLEDENPIEVLKMLDSLSDEEFDAAMNLLHHDAAAQIFRYVMDALGLRNGKVWQNIKSAASGVDTNANELAKRLNALTDRRAAKRARRKWRGLGHYISRTEGR